MRQVTAARKYSKNKVAKLGAGGGAGAKRCSLSGQTTEVQGPEPCKTLSIYVALPLGIYVYCRTLLELPRARVWSHKDFQLRTSAGPEQGNRIDGEGSPYCDFGLLSPHAVLWYFSSF